jgi:hypothetical protein
LEVNWKPLEAKLGASRCVGFMYMGSVNGKHVYKHGITRGYLYLDDNGHCFTRVGRGGFEEADWDRELAKMENDLRALGATLETPYDDAFIAGKRRALLEAGVRLVSVEIVPEDRTIH